MIKTFIQYVRQERFSQLGYSLSKLLRPVHWFQFADDAAIATGQEYETQVLLNAFTAWCTWSSMIIRVDKCHTFGMAKKETLSVKTYPKLFVNNEQIPTLKNNESFHYLGRYFNFEIDNEEHKKELLDITNKILNKVDTLPLHPNHKLDIYFKYYMSKIPWHLTIADTPNTWIKQHLRTICHNKIRYWLEILQNGTLDIILLTKAKFGLNVIDVSTKHTQCQVSLRKNLATSKNESVKFVYHDSNISSNMQYSSYKSCKDVLKDIRDSKINKILTNVSSQSLIVKSLWNE